MTNLIEQYYKAPTKVQDGVLFIMLEGLIYLTMSFVDLYHNHYVYDFSPVTSFILEIVLIAILVLCGLGILYGMKAGWIGSLVMSIVLMAIGSMFMLDKIELTLTLSGLFYFIFGLISFVELLRHSFRKWCGITEV